MGTAGRSRRRSPWLGVGCGGKALVVVLGNESLLGGRSKRSNE